MRKLNSILLIVNLAVVAAGAYFIFLKNSQHHVERENSEEQAAADVSPAEVAAAGTATVTNEVAVTNQLQWRQLESEDYRAYINRLREIGCPEQTIRDIIIADLDKLLAPRVQSLKGRRADVKYWHPEGKYRRPGYGRRKIVG